MDQTAINTPPDSIELNAPEKGFHSTNGNPFISDLDNSDLHHDLLTDELRHNITALYPKRRLGADLQELFAENIVAKIHHTARKAQKVDDGTDSLKGFPEYVTNEGEVSGDYTLREPEFWTCGFFPGTLHLLLERIQRFPKAVLLSNRFKDTQGNDFDITKLRSEITSLCNTWAAPIRAMADRRDTHDIGFIIMPALRLDWELTANHGSLTSILRAANSLASRFVPSAGAIRSWDERVQKNVQIRGMDDNLILIIDSMCNLDLLFYASKHCSDGQRLHDIATSHATTLLRTHLRPEPSKGTSPFSYKGQWYSTYHVANLDPRTGSVKRAFTAQGYSDTSTWARGQAWGVLGYAQTYMWTKDAKFLQACCGLAEYFIYRLGMCPPLVHAGNGQDTIDSASCKHHSGRYVPVWDFDAPDEDSRPAPRDSSAGAIAANGMLVLSQGLAALGYDKLAARFRTYAVDIVRDLLNFALAPEKATLVRTMEGHLESRDVSPGLHYEAIMKFGTANNNQHAMKRYANHGLVYGDYYLVEFGNQLLRMGLE